MKRIVAWVCCSWTLGITQLAVGQLVAYENLQNDLGFFLDEKSIESGDQITLAQGLPRVIDDFTFEYWLTPASFQGTETVRVRFYSLNGGPISAQDPTPTPGGVLYDSNILPLSESGRVQLTLENLNVTVPDTFVWSVQFEGGRIGQGSGGVAGVTLYSPPTVGGNTHEFWQKIGNSWDLFSFSFATDFAAKITVVPEPRATWALMLIVAAGTVGMRRLRHAGSRWRGGQPCPPPASGRAARGSRLGCLRDRR